MKTGKVIVKKVNGEDVDFFPLPMGVLFKCNKLGDAVSTLVANLFADTSKDVKIDQSSVPVKLEDGTVKDSWATVTDPIAPSLAGMRVNQKKEGIKAVIDAFTDQGAQQVLAEIICLSAKNENLKVEDFMDEIDIETFMQLLEGVKEANKGVFERLGKWLSLLVPDQLAGRVKGKLESLLTKEPTLSETETGD